MSYVNFLTSSSALHLCIWLFDDMLLCSIKKYSWQYYEIKKNSRMKVYSYLWKHFIFILKRIKLWH